MARCSCFSSSFAWLLNVYTILVYNLYLVHKCAYGLEVVSSLNSTKVYSGCLDYNLNHGNVSLVEKDSYYELHFSCTSGFKLLGKQKLKCNEQLQTESKPQCVQDLTQGCTEPPLIVNGELRIQGFKAGEFYPPGIALEYRCATGFHLVPSSERRICHNNLWTGSDPTCVPVGCPVPNELRNGQFLPEPTTSNYPVGEFLHFTCDVGFVLEGPSKIECLKTHKWSSTNHQCIRSHEVGISCSVPPLGPNVEVTAVRGMQGANTALSGTTLEATCAPGYRDIIAPCVPSLLRCVDGTWHGHFANCVSVDSCAAPLNIPHATVLKVGLESSTYSLGSQVAYSCHPDYQLVGDSVFICLPDGCWEPEILPVCHPRRSSTNHYYINPSAWSEYLKLNTSLLVSLVTIASVCVILLSVCLVLACRPHHPHSPAPLPQQPADPDRVALIAFADTVQSVLPSYEEAVRGSLGGVLNYRLQRPHWPSMLGGQRRNNRDNSRQTSSMRDSMGSTDTVTVSEVSTNVTVDTVSSHSGSQTASCHAICGSLASFDTSSVLNTDVAGVPLLEVNELEEVTTDTRGSAIDPDFKFPADIASLHS